MEFRLYNRVGATGTTDCKINCSFFDLIGHKEPDQTKGLGYVLAESSLAMKLFLQLLGDRRLVKLSSQKWVVDCELTQPTQNKQSLRADVFIRYYDGYKPTKAIVIEAKTVSQSISNVNAISQISSYRNRFLPLQAYDEKDIVLITLTTTVDLFQHDLQVRSITWQDIRTAFSSPEVQRAPSKDSSLILDYLSYINRLQNAMNYYDKEVLSIPAGNTIKTVQKCFIYECPIRGKYKSRGEKHPLYVAFRHRGEHGRITDLYKIQDIIKLDLDDSSAIDAIDSMGKYPNFKNRIEFYKKHEPTYLKELKWVFILDQDNSIKLPYPVEYDGSIKGLAGTAYLTLSEVFRSPASSEKIVKIKMKKDR